MLIIVVVVPVYCASFVRHLKWKLFFIITAAALLAAVNLLLSFGLLLLFPVFILS